MTTQLGWEEYLFHRQEIFTKGWCYTFIGGEHCYSPIRRIDRRARGIDLCADWTKHVHSRGLIKIETLLLTIPSEEIVPCFCFNTKVLSFNYPNSKDSAKLYPKSLDEVAVLRLVLGEIERRRVAQENHSGIQPVLS